MTNFPNDFPGIIALSEGCKLEAIPTIELRDYFAGLAMQGDLASPGTGGILCDPTQEYLDSRAAVYYRMADSMLKAREGK